MINQLFQREKLGNRLFGRRAKWQHDIYIADRLSYNHVVFSSGDVVFRGEQAAIVDACLGEADVFVVNVSLLARVERLHTHCCKWQHSEIVESWFAQDVQQCSAWYIDSDDCVVVLRL